MKSAHSQSSERRRGRTSLGMRLPVSGSTTVDFDIFGLLCGRAAPAQLSSHASAAQPMRAPMRADCACNADPCVAGVRLALQ